MMAEMLTVINLNIQAEVTGLGGSVGYLSDNILVRRFDHEIFAMVIHSLPLIQEGQLSGK